MRIELVLGEDLRKSQKEVGEMTEPVAKLQARVGDIVVVSGHRVGEKERSGEILEVLGDSESRHFRVRWDDEHESLFYPGPDTTVRPARSAGR